MKDFANKKEMIQRKFSSEGEPEPIDKKSKRKKRQAKEDEEEVVDKQGLGENDLVIEQIVNSKFAKRNSKFVTEFFQGCNSRFNNFPLYKIECKYLKMTEEGEIRIKNYERESERVKMKYLPEEETEEKKGDTEPTQSRKELLIKKVNAELSALEKNSAKERHPILFRLK